MGVQPGTGAATPRAAEAIVLGNLALIQAIGLFVNLMHPRSQIDKWAAPYVCWVIATAALPMLQVLISLPRFERVRARHGRWLFGLELVIAYAPVLSPFRLQANAGFPVASTLILFTGRTRWVLLAMQGAAIVAIDALLWPAESTGSPQHRLVYWLFEAAAVGLLVYGITRFATVVTSLHTTRQEAALTTLAVERLRAGRDLHDLLGFSLTAITLKLELALRALARQADATEEIREVGMLTGQAVADTRTVAAGGALTTLAAETVSARSVLGWAGVHAEVTIDIGELPPEADAALALVLREAVTNMLRHGDTSRAVITARTTGKGIRLDVRNNGAAPNPPASTGVDSRGTVGRGPGNGVGRGNEGGGGSGLRNLGARLAPLGGEVRAWREGGWFHLTAVLPKVSRRRSLTLPSGDTALVIAVVAAFFVLGALNPFPWTPAVDGIAWQGVLLGVIMQGLMIHLCRSRPGGARPWLLRPAFAAMLLVGVVPFLVGWSPAAMLQPVTVTVLLIFRGRVAWVLFGISVLAEVSFGSALLPGGPVVLLVFLAYVLESGLFALMFSVLFRLAGMVDELNEARAELARATVARERMRFGCDLRDRLGSGLFAIARCVARAQALPDGRTEEITAELAEALRLARRTSQDVRAIAHGQARHDEYEFLIAH